MGSQERARIMALLMNATAEVDWPCEDPSYTYLDPEKGPYWWTLDMLDGCDAAQEQIFAEKVADLQGASPTEIEADYTHFRNATIRNRDDLEGVIDRLGFSTRGDVAVVGALMSRTAYGRAVILTADDYFSDWRSDTSEQALQSAYRNMVLANVTIVIVKSLTHHLSESLRTDQGCAPVSPHLSQELAEHHHAILALRDTSRNRADANGIVFLRTLNERITGAAGAAERGWWIHMITAGVWAEWMNGTLAHLDDRVLPTKEEAAFLVEERLARGATAVEEYIANWMRVSLASDAPWDLQNEIAYRILGFSTMDELDDLFTCPAPA